MARARTPWRGVDNGFAKLLKQGLDSVNQTQAKATDLATQFERGVPGVELPQVMLEMQKANVSFRALTEVRNKFVDAYREIMNMPLVRRAEGHESNGCRIVNVSGQRVISGLKPLLLLVGVAAAVAAGVGVDAVVRGPDLQPAVRQPRRRRRRADHPGARQRRHSLQARGRRQLDQRAGRATRRGASEARRAGPARRRRRRRMP